MGLGDERPLLLVIVSWISSIVISPSLQGTDGLGRGLIQLGHLKVDVVEQL